MMINLLLLCQIYHVRSTDGHSETNSLRTIHVRALGAVKFAINFLHDTFHFWTLHNMIGCWKGGKQLHIWIMLTLVSGEKRWNRWLEIFNKLYLIIQQATMAITLESSEHCNSWNFPILSSTYSHKGIWWMEHKFKTYLSVEKPCQNYPCHESAKPFLIYLDEVKN